MEQISTPATDVAACATDTGHRTLEGVGLSVGELTDLLDDHDRNPGPESPVPEDWLDRAFTAVTDLDVDRLETLFRRAWDRIGALEFVVDYATPLLERIGDGWAAGLLSIADEHLASYKLRQFLAHQWRPLARAATGPTVLLTAPEDELHEGGLHMVAVVFGLADWRILFLGANTPTETILDTAHRAMPAVIGVSIAEPYGAERARSTITTIRDGLPDESELLTGGKGAPSEMDDVVTIHDLRELYVWATTHP